MKCSICGEEIEIESNGWDRGHNAAPFPGRCCSYCNATRVIPQRIYDLEPKEEDSDQFVVDQKKFESDECLDQWGSLQLNEIKNDLIAAYKKLLNVSDPKITIDNDGRGISCLWLEGKSISIEPERLTVKSIVGEKMRYGWTVTTYHHQNNYPHEPDDIDDRRYGETFGTLGVAQLAMNAVFELYCENYFNNVIDQSVQEWGDIAAGIRPKNI